MAAGATGTIITAVFALAGVREWRFRAWEQDARVEFARLESRRARADDYERFAASRGWHAYWLDRAADDRPFRGEGNRIDRCLTLVSPSRIAGFGSVRIVVRVYCSDGSSVEKSTIDVQATQL
jgi:hypothetical protein